MIHLEQLEGQRENPSGKSKEQDFESEEKQQGWKSNKGTGGMESSVVLVQTAHPSVRMHCFFCLKHVGL